jgi:hypothetical protein
MQIIQFVIDLFVVYFGSGYCLSFSKYGTLSFNPQLTLTLSTITTLASPWSVIVPELKVQPSLAAPFSPAIWVSSSTFTFKHTRHLRVARNLPTVLLMGTGSYLFFYVHHPCLQ